MCSRTQALISLQTTAIASGLGRRCGRIVPLRKARLLWLSTSHNNGVNGVIVGRVNHKANYTCPKVRTATKTRNQAAWAREGISPEGRG